MSWRMLVSLAWRESRFARRRLFLFLSSITLGVAALVAVQGFSAAISAGVAEQARTLLGADLSLSSRQPFAPPVEALLDSLQRSGARTARVTSLASMALAPATGQTRLVQLRAVEPGYPFYGAIETRPAGVWPRLQTEADVLVDPALLGALGIAVGDSLRLGEASFRVAGVLEKVPGDVEIASVFAPRVYLAARYLAATKLVEFGSRVDYDAYLRLPRASEATALSADYAPLLRAEKVRARTAEQHQQSLGETLGRLSSYLGLIGVFALLLGGIGVASAMSAYIARKQDTVATLRCLGATGWQVLGIYLLQAAAMGLGGAVAGVVLGLAVQGVLPYLLADLLPVDVQLGVHPAVVVGGVGVGVWVAVVFALLPLLATRQVSPLLAIRRQVEAPRAPRRDPWRWGAWALLAASVFALVVLQAGSLPVGAAFTGGVAATLLLLAVVAWAVTRGVRRLAALPLPYPPRQGVANLHRPGNQTPAVILALGFGVFLLATLLLVQDNLLRPLRQGAGAERANLLLWDVQLDQRSGIEALLAERGSSLAQQAPIVPMRVAAINGRDVRAEASGEAVDEAPAAGEGRGARGGRGGQPAGWALRREYRSTYRDTLVGSETLLASAACGAGEKHCGALFPATGDRQLAPVSLEKGIAEDLGVGVGDRITWDVQGVEIASVVTSLREVDWARFEPNFFAVFPTRALADAPQTWVLLARAPGEAEREALQNAIVQRYPNVAALDLTQMQQALDAVIGRVSTAIRFLAAFSIATGFLVLLGAIATGRLQRIRESVLLRTLGASWRQIGTILLTEYLLLGTLGALAGVGLSVAAGWALAHWLFHVPFAVPVAPLVGLGVGVALLAALIGAIASREVFGHTPLELIREEQ